MTRGIQLPVGRAPRYRSPVRRVLPRCPSDSATGWAGGWWALRPASSCWRALRSSRGIVATARAGDPFVTANVRRIRVLAALTLGYFVLKVARSLLAIIIQNDRQGEGHPFLHARWPVRRVAMPAGRPVEIRAIACLHRHARRPGAPWSACGSCLWARPPDRERASLRCEAPRARDTRRPRTACASDRGVARSPLTPGLRMMTAPPGLTSCGNPGAQAARGDDTPTPSRPL